MRKVVAIMPVRNEAWILGLSARALLRWVDHLVILDHCSTDNSREIAMEIAFENPGNVTLLAEVKPEWAEMHHRHRLLVEARAQFATHVVTVDADEVLTGNLLPTIRSYVETTPAGAIMQVPWIQLRTSPSCYHSRGSWASQDVSMAFVDAPQLNWSPAADGYQHHHRHPYGVDLLAHLPLGPAFACISGGGLMHLQMVSERRLKAKQALYLMNEVLRWPGRMTPAQLNAMYRPTVSGNRGFGDDVQLAQVPAEWWEPYADLMQHLDVDAEPWQQAECERLWAKHGAETFAGLDLFGVVG